MKLKGDRRCAVCREPIAPSNKAGICQRTKTCRREYERARSEWRNKQRTRQRRSRGVQVRQTRMPDSEYLALMERMRAECQRREISFVQGMKAAIRSYLAKATT